jgi:hypothetical protein
LIIKLVILIYNLNYRNDFFLEEKNMEELVKLVVQKTGVSEDVARQAIGIVLGFLKEKLPAPIAGQIDAVVSGSNPLGGLGKMFG